MIDAWPTMSSKVRFVLFWSFTSLCSVDYIKQLLRGEENQEKWILDEYRLYNSFFFNVC